MNQEAIKLIKEAIKHYGDKETQLKGEILSFRIKIEDAEKELLKLGNIRQSLEAALERLEEADEKEKGGLKMGERPALKIPEEAILEVEEIEDPQELKESPGTGEIMEEVKPGEDLTDEDKDKATLEKADKLIKRETEKWKTIKKDWKKCPKCNRRPVAPWNRKGICSTCQTRKKTNRPYKKRNVVI